MASASFVDKIKSAFSKLKLKRKSKVSSFKTPQDLLGERYGHVATDPNPESAVVHRVPTASSTIAAPTQADTTPRPPVSQSVPRFQEPEDSGDVSPTDGPLREGRPVSDAVSALDQEEISERLRKTVSVESAQDVLLKAERPTSPLQHVVSDEDIEPASSAIAPVNSVHKSSPAAVIEHAEHPVDREEEPQAPFTEEQRAIEPVQTPKIEEPVASTAANESNPALAAETSTEAPITKVVSATSTLPSQIERNAVESRRPSPPLPSPPPPAVEESPIDRLLPHTHGERHPVTLEDAPASAIDPPAEPRLVPEVAKISEGEDRIDPTTAPEVVNDFDDEKVPVEEPVVSSPTTIKFSATSGPLEDFPVGEYYN